MDRRQMLRRLARMGGLAALGGPEPPSAARAAGPAPTRSRIEGPFYP